MATQGLETPAPHIQLERQYIQELYSRIKNNELLVKLYNKYLEQDNVIPNKFNFYQRGMVPNGSLRQYAQLTTLRDIRRKKRKRTDLYPDSDTEIDSDSEKTSNKRICSRKISMGGKYADISSSHKDAHNTLLVETIQQYITSSPKCLILDGKHMRTTHALLGSDIDSTHIYVVERDFNTWRYMQELSIQCIEKDQSYIRPHNIIYEEQGLKMFIQRYGSQFITDMNVFYLDYMGTLLGSDYCRPLQDMGHILSLLPSNRRFILASTFSLRDKRGGDNEQKIMEEREKLAGLFLEHGITCLATMKDGCKYRRPNSGSNYMHFMIYVLHKGQGVQIIPNHK